MAEYIERKALYRKLLELEALARARVLDTPTTSPAYQRYSAQLTERNAIRHMIAEIPAADVAPVVHGRWIDNGIPGSMGIIDAFSKEDRTEITVSQLYELVKEAGRADLFRNGVKNKIPYAHILCVIDGDASALAVEKPVIWHDAKTDPPKSPGLYYGKKDDTNSMWLCNYRDGKWTLSNSFTAQEMDVILWAEYTAFSEDV